MKKINPSLSKAALKCAIELIKVVKDDNYSDQNVEEVKQKFSKLEEEEQKKVLEVVVKNISGFSKVITLKWIAVALGSEVAKEFVFEVLDRMIASTKDEDELFWCVELKRWLKDALE